MFLSVTFDPNATSRTTGEMSATIGLVYGDMLTEGIPGEVVSDKIRLEEGTHLRVSRPGMIQDEEVDLERYHVNDDRGDDETSDTGTPVPKLVPLFPLSSERLWSGMRNELTRDIFRSPNLCHRSSTVYTPTKAVTNRPTSFTLRMYSVQEPE